jgi:homospermidine synthase
MEPSQIVIIGFGAIAKSFITILLNSSSKLQSLPVVIFEPKDLSSSETFNLVSSKMKTIYIQTHVKQNNYISLFKKYVKQNAIVLEAAYRISTLDIINECQKYKCVYLSTACDSWVHSNSTLFEVQQKIMKGIQYDNQHMTAVLNHGMNPGLVSHFVKYLLSQLAIKSKNTNNIDLLKQNKYNQIAQNLGLSLIQIAERDTQISNVITTEKLFCNTWSVIGFVDEATLGAEISWGTHEKKLPSNADTSKLNDTCQIYLRLHGNQLRTLSYEPEGGRLSGYCIPHAECYSLAQFLQIKNNSQILYRPTVYYSYLVSDNAKLMSHYLDYCLDSNFLPLNEHVLRSDEIISGYDSVGCLVFFGNKNDTTELAGKRYWIGSIMSNEIAKNKFPEINVTCMQVGISILSCIEWMIQNPNQGVIEPEEVDTTFILDYCKKWLGKLFCLDVTSKCGLDSDQFSDLVVFPNGIIS